MLLKDLLENDIGQELRFTLPPTYVMPELPNNDAYLQYRHMVALASARSMQDRGLEHTMAQDSPWGENQAVVCYVPQDVVTLELANKIMGVKKIPLTSTSSRESPSRQTTSPVRKFVDITEGQVLHPHGTIVTLIPSKTSAASISGWCKDNGISCMSPEKLHCTVLFSRKPVESLLEIDKKQVGIKTQVKGWKKLGNVLTLELAAPMISKIHDWMISHGGTHDYPQFIPHLSVCYDWNNEDIPNADPCAMMIEFDRLQVQPIDPKYAEKAVKDP